MTDSEAVPESTEPTGDTAPQDDHEGPGGAAAEGDPGRQQDQESDAFRAEFSLHADGEEFRTSARDGGLGDLATRLLRVGAEAVNQTTGRLREAGEEVKPREFLTGAVRMTAKGREELVGLVAREVRMYLEKLKIGDDLRALMTEHSLEIQASFRLKPLAEDAPADPEPDSS
ncbi:MAG: hypothetical protein CMP23_07835 [Rickettsiales bacterium]|nr:hypothetical protein [Rickettsiales bacterium]